MGDTNYIGGVFKILEPPKQKVLKNNVLVTKVRAQIPQVRSSSKRIINLTFWGNLARDVTMYYKIDDYLIIEGYLSLRDKKGLNLKNQKSKKIEITAIKVYPFLLSYDRSIRKT
jgi:single-stranded DNA-binding protein